jgi:Family of unknown function (DUF5686)/CarboxypepD_reg-like domain
MILINKKYLFAVLILTILTSTLKSYSQISDSTIIKGTVVDAKTGTPLTGVTVLLKNTTVGTNTDINGKYRIATKIHADKIQFSFIGYETENRSINPGRIQKININLKMSSISLEEVIVKPGKEGYKNRNNPAVELIEKVIGRKDMNNQKSYDFLQYKQYDKIQFALSNVTEKFENGNFFGKFRFIFENLDTTKRINKNVLPLYIKESRSDHFYRKDPPATKDIILAEKTVNLDEYLDNRGVSANLKYLYQHINIYDNDILFLTNTFISPIASTAPLFYKYYIIDTLSVDQIKCIRLYFEPRNKSDFLFHGHLYITLDSSYAVRKIDMGLNKNINIDWVKEISITQDFDKFGQKKWLLSRDEISVDFGFRNSTMGLYGQRTISYRDYVIDKPIDKKIFEGPIEVVKIEPGSDSARFWEANRYVPLSKSEKGVYTTIDSIRKIPAFRRKMNLIMLITTGFYNFGNLEIGPAESFYSYNTVEGSRFRFGGRTTPSLNRKIIFDAYAAYGLADRVIKYNAGITYSFTDRTIYQFPVESFRLSYENEIKIPGQELQLTQRDNILLSPKRGINDKFFFDKTLRAEFFDEFENHFSYLIGYSFTKQSPYGNLHFITNDTASLNNNVSHINVSEVYLKLRYAPNESFYQGKLYRFPVPNKYPVIQLNIAGGLRSMHNDYNYLRLQFSISRRFYPSVLGYTDVTFEAGKIFGQVPYPLLFIHNANQTYAYVKDAYNLMNFMEFVSDQYVSLNIDHSFNGFFFNKVPLLKKLKLREIVTCKILYGGLSNFNNPGYHNNLLEFPVDNYGIPLTYSLGNKPYIEASVGVSNLFKIFRIDLIRRFSYLNYPNVSGLGIRIQFRFDI